MNGDKEKHRERESKPDGNEDTYLKKKIHGGGKGGGGCV